MTEETNTGTSSGSLANSDKGTRDASNTGQSGASSIHFGNTGNTHSGQTHQGQTPTRMATQDRTTEDTCPYRFSIYLSH